ncbi:MAG: hypothetical protein QM630_04975 [Microbacterium sp.]
MGLILSIGIDDVTHDVVVSKDGIFSFMTPEIEFVYANGAPADE